MSGSLSGCLSGLAAGALAALLVAGGAHSPRAAPLPSSVPSLSVPEILAAPAAEWTGSTSVSQLPPDVASLPPAVLAPQVRRLSVPQVSSAAGGSEAKKAGDDDQSIGELSVIIGLGQSSVGGSDATSAGTLTRHRRPSGRKHRSRNWTRRRRAARRRALLGEQQVEEEILLPEEGQEGVGRHIETGRDTLKEAA